jgi:hypothetical protein
LRPAFGQAHTVAHGHTFKLLPIPITGHPATPTLLFRTIIFVLSPLIPFFYFPPFLLKKITKKCFVLLSKPQVNFVECGKRLDKSWTKVDKSGQNPILSKVYLLHLDKTFGTGQKAKNPFLSTFETIKASPPLMFSDLDKRTIVFGQKKIKVGNLNKSWIKGPG